MRNEAPFLLEWIAYHRAIGFDKICIVTNDCDDGSVPLLHKLAAAGVITHFDQIVPQGQSPQAAAVALVERMDVLQAGDWGIFLDADEYLNIHTGNGTVAELAAAIAQMNAIGMLIAWRLFGDSGHKYFPGSYLLESYASCEKQPTFTQFKTFFRKGEVALGFSQQLHRCRLVPGMGRAADFLIGSGHPIKVGMSSKPERRHRRWLQNGEESFSHLMGDEIDFTLAQINHYIVRDPWSFALKQRRGRGYATSEAAKLRHTARFYRLNNHNTGQDVTILRWQGAVAEQKRELINQCQLEGALAQIAQIYDRP